MQISEAVDGFVSDDEADDYVAEEDFDEFDEEDDDDGAGRQQGADQEARGAEGRGAGEVRRAARQLRQDAQGLREGRLQVAVVQPAQQAISAELMTIRFTVKTIEKLCDILRSQVDDVRRYERELRKIVVDKCGMPQDHFIKTFPPNVDEPEVGREGSRARASPTARCWRATCRRCRSCSRS